MGSGVLYPREQLEGPATDLAEAFAVFGYFVALGGSLARGREQVRDVDMIVSRDESPTPPETIVRLIFGFDRVQKIGVEPDGRVTKEKFLVELSDVGRVKFEVWIVPEECLGTAMLIVRGPANLNDLYRKVAAEQGMELTISGLMIDGRNLAAGKDEDEVFDLLGLPRIPVEERGVFEGMTQYEMEVPDGQPQAGTS